MKRARLNYWVDVLIGITFVVSSVSGLVFLLPPELGSADTARILGLSYRLWDQLHVWGSLGMIAGVAAHLVLHAKWIVIMSRNMLGRKTTRSDGGQATSPESDMPRSARRRFLRLAGGVAGGGAVVAVFGTVLGQFGQGISSADEDDGLVVESVSRSSTSKGDLVADPTPSISSETGVSVGTPQPPVQDESSTADAATDVQQATVESEVAPMGTAIPTTVPTVTPEAVEELCVACPHGLVNDPYPGRCRRYRDSDGDGICDYSIPTPCG